MVLIFEQFCDFFVVHHFEKYPSVPIFLNIVDIFKKTTHYLASVAQF